MRAILTYHSIDESGSPISISRRDFRRHIEWFASGAVQVLPLDVLAAEHVGRVVQPVLVQSGGFFSPLSVRDVKRQCSHPRGLIPAWGGFPPAKDEEIRHRVGASSPAMGARRQAHSRNEVRPGVHLPPRGRIRRVHGVARGEDRDHPILVETERQVTEYFDGTRQTFTVMLDFNGTGFQKSVWQALLKIPCGQTRSYGDIAKSLGNPKAVRAVGAANGKNPISIIAPCHRVIGSTGRLTGFAGGLEVKARLLAFERATTEKEPTASPAPFPAKGYVAQREDLR